MFGVAENSFCEEYIKCVRESSHKMKKESWCFVSVPGCSLCDCFFVSLGSPSPMHSPFSSFVEGADLP